MRTLRLSLVGMVIMALLGGLSGVVAAQEERSGGGPALVTGVGTCIGEYVQSSDGPGWHSSQASGGTCSLDVDDRRLAGAMTVDFTGVWFDGSHPDPEESGGFYWAAIEVTGPDGSWVGSFTGVDDITEWEASGDRQQILMVLWGTKDYAGQTFLAHLTGNLSDPILTVNGLVYEGPPPPWLFLDE